MTVARREPLQRLLRELVRLLQRQNIGIHRTHPGSQFGLSGRLIQFHPFQNVVTDQTQRVNLQLFLGFGAQVFALLTSILAGSRHTERQQ